MSKYIYAYADASYCPMTGRAGMGLWAVSLNANKQDSRMIPGGASSSGEAEALALMRAASLALDHFAREDDTIVAISDCEEAVDLLNGVRPPKSTMDRLVRDRGELVRAATLLGVNLKFERFGDHRALSDAAKAIHTWCDRAARQVVAETSAFQALSASGLRVA